MAKLVAMLRVKDGILFVHEWLENVSLLVDEIVVVDNGSTDGSLEALQKHSKVVSIDQTEGFDEGRDKILAYKRARQTRPDWVLWLDVDEFFEKRITREKLDRMISSKIITRYFFRKIHFHKDYQHFEARLDKLIVISRPHSVLWKEQATGHFQNLKIHSGLIQGIKGLPWISNIRIKHVGAVDRDYLNRKTDVYLSVDPLRSQMYIRHRDQLLPTWEWHEYDEAPLLVRLQNVLLWLLFAAAISTQFASGLLRGIKRRIAVRHIKKEAL